MKNDLKQFAQPKQLMALILAGFLAACGGGGGGGSGSNASRDAAVAAAAAAATAAGRTLTVSVGAGTGVGGAGVGPAPVDLLSIKTNNFAILTKSGITSTGTTSIVGNIGASPITAAAMNTVPCSEITGFIYGV